MSTGEYAPLNVRPFEFAERERRQIAMREALDVITLKTAADQQFTALHFNRDVEDQNPLIVMGGFLASVMAADNKYRGYQHAAAFPDRQVLIMDLPAHGESSPFTAEQRAEISSKRGFSKIGKAMLEAAVSRFKRAETFTALAGASFGGRIMLDMVEAADGFDLDSRAMVGTEITGIEDCLDPGLLYGFFWQEWRLQQKYKKDPGARHLYDAYDDFQRRLELFGHDSGAYHMYGVYAKDPRSTAAFIFHSALATRSGFDVIGRVMEKYPQLKAAFLSGGQSKVARVDKIWPDVEKLLAEFPDRLSWDVWPNDSHGLGLPEHQPRLAKFTRDKVNKITA